MTEDQQKPMYYDFLKRLLTQKRLNKEAVEDILNQYEGDPNGFEADFYQMHRYLNFMGLRSQEADYIALAFHSQVNQRPEWELAQSYGIMLPTSLQQRGQYSSGPNPQGRAGGPQYGYQSAPQDDDGLDIKGLMKLKQEMEIMKEIFKDDTPTAPQTPTDPMQFMMPWMMMMNPNMQMQTKMGKDSQGNDVVQGFTIVPSTGQAQEGGDLISTYMANQMAKSDRMEQALLDTVMGQKDEKIAELRNKVDQVASVRGSDYMLEEMKRFQEVGRIMNPTGVTGGDPQVAMQLAEMQLKNDRVLAELANKQEDHRFRNQLALREYVDNRKEKMAQMQLSEQALGALSGTVGKIVSEIGGPLASAASVGVAEQLKGAPQAGPAPAATGTRLEDLTEAQLQESIRKAQELREHSDKTSSQMLQYEQAFLSEIGKRGSTAAAQPTDDYSEPIPLDEEVAEATEWDGKSPVDLDPATFTITK